jgi:putative endonuclease
MSRTHRYYTYILTNPSLTSLYIGVTNNIRNRLTQHREQAETPNVSTYTSRYNCIHLVYTEEFQWVQDAISREKELKGWSRAKKMELIRSFNPDMRFLEEDW